MNSIEKSRRTGIDVHKLHRLLVAICFVFIALPTYANTLPEDLSTEVHNTHHQHAFQNLFGNSNKHWYGVYLSNEKVGFLTIDTGLRSQSSPGHFSNSAHLNIGFIHQGKKLVTIMNSNETFLDSPILRKGPLKSRMSMGRLSS